MEFSDRDSGWLSGWLADTESTEGEFVCVCPLDGLLLDADEGPFPAAHPANVREKLNIRLKTERPFFMEVFPPLEWSFLTGL
jgi:hypothetical protein